MSSLNPVFNLPKLKSLLYRTVDVTTWNCPNLEILKFEGKPCNFESSLEKLEQFTFYAGVHDAYKILDNAPNLKKVAAPQISKTFNPRLLQELDIGYHSNLDWNKFQTLTILNLKQ